MNEPITGYEDTEPGFIRPRFPHPPGHKPLAELALETGDPDALVLFVDPHSWVPYRVQVAWLWIKRALGWNLT